LKKQKDNDLPVGTQALILSKLYYGVLSKNLEELEIERYYSVLYFLHGKSGCNQQCICNNLAIDKTAMVKVIDYLIKAGYVVRETNPDDRREHVILLTRKGQKRSEEIVKSFHAIDEQIFSKIPKNDKTAFIRVLALLSENLRGLPSTDVFFNYKRTEKRNSDGKRKKQNEAA
jgi:MarR family transcriptional regulator for hemolysin